MALSILAMGGTALVGMLNKKDLEGEIVTLTDTKAEIQVVSEDLSQTEDMLVDERKNEDMAKNMRDQVSAQVGEAEMSLSRLNGQISTVDDDLKKTKIEQDEIDIAIKKVFPDGQIRTAEDFRQMRAAIQQEKQALENTKAELTATLASVQTQRMSQENRVKSGEKTQIERAQKIALNGLEATVIAVNREWGFVMVNAGKNYGVTNEASLLVKRGNERVARLRIVDLGESAVVCAVVEESLAEGTKINPGDKVIFENTKS
ncbi:MAG: hypothetical protein HKN23_15900 [Verrucomicrobiales bacterium]|nr:hypothetical protein [Verrucomicrobiales bacterium]